MSEGFRETICSRCAHLHVCAYKSIYLVTIMQLENTLNQVEQANEFMKFHDPDCKFWKGNEPSQIQYRADTLKTPEELFGSEEDQNHIVREAEGGATE